jgi:hypothetical protein
MNREIKKESSRTVASNSVAIIGAAIAVAGMISGNVEEAAGGVSLAVTGAGLKGWDYEKDLLLKAKEKILEPLRRD